jgi:hypothetical protein
MYPRLHASGLRFVFVFVFILGSRGLNLIVGWRDEMSSCQSLPFRTTLTRQVQLINRYTNHYYHHEIGRRKIKTPKI